MRTIIGLTLALGLSTAALAQDAPAIELGNGKKNWIMVDDVSRSADSTYTEQRVT